MDGQGPGPETNLEDFKIRFNVIKFSPRLLNLILKIPNKTRDPKLKRWEND